MFICRALFVSGVREFGAPLKNIDCEHILAGTYQDCIRLNWQVF